MRIFSNGRKRILEEKKNFCQMFDEQRKFMLKRLLKHMWKFRYIHRMMMMKVSDEKLNFKTLGLISRVFRWTNFLRKVSNLLRSFSPHKPSSMNFFSWLKKSYRRKFFENKIKWIWNGSMQIFQPHFYSKISKQFTKFISRNKKDFNFLHWCFHKFKVLLCFF